LYFNRVSLHHRHIGGGRHHSTFIELVGTKNNPFSVNVNYQRYIIWLYDYITWCIAATRKWHWL